MPYFRQWLLVLGIFCLSVKNLSALAPASGFFSGEASGVWQIGLGFQTGMIKEYVFVGDYLLSRLDWKLKVQPELRTALHFRSDQWVFGFSACLGLPLSTGWMKDYDWAEKNSLGLLYNGILSHYSEHDLIPDQAFCLELSAYLQLGKFIGGQAWLGSSLGWQRYSMHGRDGFAEYPPGSTPVPFYGKVISYTTDQLRPLVGVLIEWASTTLSAAFEVRGSLIGFERAYDQHHLRREDFYDFFYFVPSIEIRTSVSLAVSDKVRCLSSLHLSLFPKTRGKSYLTKLDSGKSYRLSSEGGASSWFAGIETGLQFSFKE